MTRAHRLPLSFLDVWVTLPLFCQEPPPQESRPYGFCDWEDRICIGMLTRASQMSFWMEDKKPQPRQLEARDVLPLFTDTPPFPWVGTFYQ